MSCSVHPVSNEAPQVELIPRVTAEHIHLRAVLHSRSTRPVALVDHPEFSRLLASPKKASDTLLGCSFRASPRAEWNQVKMLPAGQTLVLETTIPYLRRTDGTWVMTVDYGAGNSGVYTTRHPQCVATFQYSFDRKSKPLFWWLSGKTFLTTPLQANQVFQLKP
ncbi:hypothetical protein [Prosthecobacter dejongeii]|nr:hypothetical protein [Prosthecobacter dejongeii]